MYVMNKYVCLARLVWVKELTLLDLKHAINAQKEHAHR